MGTLRWEKESAEKVEREVADVALELSRVRLEAEEAVLEVRAKSLQTELLAKQLERSLLERTGRTRNAERSSALVTIGQMRGADEARAEAA